MATQYFNRFSSYCQMIKDAKDVARRSILIDHCGATNIDLKRGLTNIDHVYSIERETRRGITRLSLIEFKSIDDAERVAKQAKYCDGLLPVPLKFFQYKGPNFSNTSNKLDQTKTTTPYPIENVKLCLRRTIDNTQDLDQCYGDTFVRNKMSLVGLKLRFMTLVNFERILCSGLFEGYELMPYGSSVIDIGSDMGDLDLLMTRKIDHQKFIENYLANHNTISIEQQQTDSLRVNHNNHLTHLDKTLNQEQADSNSVKGAIRLFDHILRQYMPLTDSHNVISVPRAKVPIIKFTSRITAIDCDLSFNLGFGETTQTYSGIIMSQLLYSICRNNNLFTSLVVYLRTFGKLTGITGKGGTVKFTNFQFLSLIMFYLQQIELTNYNGKLTPITDTSGQEVNEISFELKQKKHGNPNRKSVLPSFKLLLEPGFNLSDPQWTILLNEQQLNQLLPKVVKGFFEYYSNFDFSKKSLNLYEARCEVKADNSTIYVVNPLERSRNICYNVTSRGYDHFVKRIRTALISTTNNIDDSHNYKDLITQLWSDNPFPAVIKKNSIQ